MALGRLSRGQTGWRAGGWGHGDMLVVGQMEGGARKVGWERGCPGVWGRGFIHHMWSGHGPEAGVVTVSGGLGSGNWFHVPVHPQHILGIMGSFPIQT